MPPTPEITSRARRALCLVTCGLCIIFAGSHPPLAAADAYRTQSDPAYQYVIIKAPAPPVMDGHPDEFSSAPKMYVTIPNGAVCEFSFLWDETSLYGAVQCRDVYLDATNTAQDPDIFYDDSINHFFDTNFDGTASLPFSAPGPGDYSIGLNILNSRMTSTGPGWNTSWQPVILSQVLPQGTVNQDGNTDTGYAMEWKITWADWGIDAPVFGTRWGINLKLNDRRADSVFTMSKSWTNSPGDNETDPYFTGCARFGTTEQAAALEWIAARHSPIFANTINNLVGQVHCRLAGTDVLTGITVQNLGTAQAGQEITNVRLWHRAGGGGFDSERCRPIGTLKAAGDRVWTLTTPLGLQDSDALYFTADISALPRTGLTCQFSLPAQAATFTSSWPREDVALVNDLTQTIRRSANLLITLDPGWPPPEVLQGTAALELLHIRLDNQRGTDFILNSLCLNLYDREGREATPDTVLDRVWLTQGAMNITGEFVQENQVMFTFAPGAIIRDGTDLILNIFGDIRAEARGQYRLGLKDSYILNQGLARVEPSEAVGFPWLSRPLTVFRPNQAEIFKNYPNPFKVGRESTSVLFYLERSGWIRLQVKSLSGESLKILFDGERAPGLHSAIWDGRNEQGYFAKSGVYILDLDINYHDGRAFTHRRKIALIR